MTDKGEPNGSGGPTATPPTSGNAPGTSKVAQQLTKMRDANAKYKNLLKLAKERITQQEEELQKLRGRLRCFIQWLELWLWMSTHEVIVQLYCTS